MIDFNSYFNAAKHNLELAHDATQRGLFTQAEDHVLNASIELRLVNAALRLQNAGHDDGQTP